MGICKFIMPEGMQIVVVTREPFDNMLLKKTRCKYDNYGLVSR